MTMNTTTVNKTQLAKLNYLHMAPRKVRLIADTLKGMPIKEAEAQLVLRPQRSSKPLLKLLRSAVASAKSRQLDPAKLFISSLRVDQGPMYKRSLPRAQGRATPIQKKMSHITLILQEKENRLTERFVINPPVKKEKKSKKGASKPKTESVKKAEPVTKPGFFKKLFQRKSV